MLALFTEPFNGAAGSLTDRAGLPAWTTSGTSGVINGSGQWSGAWGAHNYIEVPALATASGTFDVEVVFGTVSGDKSYTSLLFGVSNSFTSSQSYYGVKASVSWDEFNAASVTLHSTYSSLPVVTPVVTGTKVRIRFTLGSALVELYVDDAKVGELTYETPINMLSGGSTNYRAGLCGYSGDTSTSLIDSLTVYDSFASPPDPDAPMLRLIDDLTGSGALTGSAVQSTNLAFGAWTNYGHDRGVGGARFNSYGGASNRATSTGPCPLPPHRYLLEVGMAAAPSVYVSAQLAVNDTSAGTALGPRIVYTDTGMEYHMQGASPTLLYKDTTVYGDGVEVLRRLDIDADAKGFKCSANGTLLASGTFAGASIPAALGTIFVQIGTDRYGGPDPTVARHHNFYASLNESDAPEGPTPAFWTGLVNSYEVP